MPDIAFLALIVSVIACFSSSWMGFRAVKVTIATEDVEFEQV